MGRLVLIGDGPAAEVFLHQILKYPRDFQVTIFGGSFLCGTPEFYEYEGLEVRQGVRIVEIDRHALVAMGDDGSRTPYERLVLATGRSGLRPAGLQTANGILINQNFETSDGHIYAIGDCAEARNPEDKLSMVWQARTLAAMLAGNVPAELPLRSASVRPVTGKILQFPPLSKKDEKEAITA